MSDQATDATMTIGAVAQATGVPPNTLRTWERRYGFPMPSRTPGGHRLYDHDDVEKIRWVARALDRGYRPSQVVDLSLDDLKDAVASAAPPPPDPHATPETFVNAWIDATARLDGAALELAFRTETAQLGALDFLIRRVGPFCAELGTAWERGKLQVFQEHFVTARLQAWLGNLWRPLSDRNQGPLAVTTTLPGEQHTLGLHMASAALALGGWRVLFLGASTPLDDVLDAVESTRADAVAVSMSVHGDRDHTGRQLADLEGRLGEVPLLAGGGGAPLAADDPLGGRLDKLAHWAREAAW